MTRQEVTLLHNAGIAVVTIHQPSDGFLLEGFDRGMVAMQEAMLLAAACGMPPGRPVYFALDVDPNTLTEAQWTAIEHSLDGAASLFGRDQVGIYGGFLAIERLVPSHATYGWQTASWSQERWSSQAHLRQVWHEVSACGGTIDLNMAVVEDYGQW